MGEALSGFTFDTLADIDEMGTVLRLIARKSIQHDVDGPRFMRVCRAFRYCWDLAIELERIDMTRIVMPVYSSGAIPLLCLPRETQVRIMTKRERDQKRLEFRTNQIAPLFSIGNDGKKTLYGRGYGRVGRRLRRY